MFPSIWALWALWALYGRIIPSRLDFNFSTKSRRLSWFISRFRARATSLASSAMFVQRSLEVSGVKSILGFGRAGDVVPGLVRRTKGLTDRGGVLLIGVEGPSTKKKKTPFPFLPPSSLFVGLVGLRRVAWSLFSGFFKFKPRLNSPRTTPLVSFSPFPRDLVRFGDCSSG